MTRVLLSFDMLIRRLCMRQKANALAPCWEVTKGRTVWTEQALFDCFLNFDCDCCSNRQSSGHQVSASVLL
jgi:hypothetical protein